MFIIVLLLFILGTAMTISMYSFMYEYNDLAMKCGIIGFISFIVGISIIVVSYVQQ